MEKLLRYPDLVERGIIRSRMTLKRRIDDQDFPPGRLISPNCRAWTEKEIEEWLATRPVARKPARQKSTAPDGQPATPGRQRYAAQSARPPPETQPA
jgi:predicted DNA-binding transcriptional regulator AlpA